MQELQFARAPMSALMGMAHAIQDFCIRNTEFLFLNFLFNHDIDSVKIKTILIISKSHNYRYSE